MNDERDWNLVKLVLNVVPHMKIRSLTPIFNVMYNGECIIYNYPYNTVVGYYDHKIDFDMQVNVEILNSGYVRINGHKIYAPNVSWTYMYSTNFVHLSLNGGSTTLFYNIHDRKYIAYPRAFTFVNRSMYLSEQGLMYYEMSDKFLIVSNKLADTMMFMGWTLEEFIMRYENGQHDLMKYHVCYGNYDAARPCVSKCQRYVFYVYHKKIFVIEIKTCRTYMSPFLLDFTPTCLNYESYKGLLLGGQGKIYESSFKQ